MNFPNFKLLPDESVFRELYSPSTLATLSSFVKKKECWKSETMPVIIISCEFSQQNFQPVLFRDMGINCPESIRCSVRKRQAEFLVGRYLSKRAMSYFDSGRDLLEFQLAIGAHRSPVWPPHLTGSISHSSNIALSVVAQNSPDKNWFLGIDVEDIVDNDSLEHLKNYVLREEDKRLLDTIEAPENLLLTMIFSAKEALFKATYQYVGKYFDFDCAKINFVNLEEQCIGLSFVSEFQLETGIADSFLCYYSQQGGSICTLIAQ